MITIEGKWVMEGLDSNDGNRIKSSKELTDFINDIGFLPLFKNKVKGFSVEELTDKNSWWGDNPLEDPWVWREVLASKGEVAYGKYFSNRAGFVSRKWYPIFATYRRDGYDFDSRYEDGLASYRAKKVMDILTEYETLPSYELKAKAGFCKNGEKGFDGVMTLLQMQTYITVSDFKRKHSRKNEEYGWSVASYSLAEGLFGEDYVHSEYHRNSKEAKEEIVTHLLKKYPNASYHNISKCI